MRALPALMLIAAAIATQNAPAAERICDRSGSFSTPSPDGRWVANVQEEVCETAAGGAAAGVTLVLASQADPALSWRVFIMPVPRSRDDWPRIRWNGPGTVELRVANLSEAPPPEPVWQGIRVSLVFCQDNPEDRARLVAHKAAVQQWQQDVTAWVERRNVDAVAAGPRPPRPEEPRLAPGRCTD